MADSEHNSSPVDSGIAANPNDSQGSRANGEFAHASTSSGTVIIPRSNGRALGPTQAGPIDSNSSYSTGRPRGPHVPLSQGEDEDLISQQTVISQQPWSDPPEYGSVTPREMGRLLAGQTLGHYSLLEFVGGGGMGAVFRARDTMLNRTVAVKVLAPGQSSDEDTLRRFQNEAQSAARLDHENIGRVHYVGQDRGWHYIVFEFIEGENLRDLIERRGTPSISDTLGYLQQLGDALDHADAREVVHRDIKPSNVIITPENRAKLVDMGLARLHQVEHSREDLTASGVTLGTFDYISPEQARDPRSADVRSDLYSLGCTLYFMLTGRPPFPHGTVLQKLLQHQADQPVDPRIDRPDLPADLIAILNKLTAKQPSKRYQTPREMLADVRSLSIKLGLKSSDVARVTQRLLADRSWWFRNIPWLVPVSVIAVVPLIFSLFASNPVEPQRPDWSRPATIETPATVAGNPASTPSPKAIARSTKSGNTATNSQSSVERTRSLVSGGPVPIILDLSRNYSRDVANGYLANWQQSVWPNLPETIRTTGLDSLGAEIEKIFDPITSVENLANPAARPAVDEPDRLIVAPDSGREGDYATLAAAVRDARAGDTIELRFSGVSREKAFSLTNPSLSIVAATGERPTILFSPENAGAMNTSRGMISVNGGELRLSGIDFELRIAQSTTSDVRSLFELRQVEFLGMEDCTITIHDDLDAASRSQNAVIEIREGVSSTLSLLNDPRKVAEPIRIALERSIVRGTANLIRSLERESHFLTLNECWLALSESALYADYGVRESRRANEPRFRMDFRDCTAIFGHGMARLINAERTTSRDYCEFRCANTILRGNEANPFFEIESLDRSEELREVLRWETDGVRIDDFSSLGRISGMNGTTNLGARQWNEYWRMRQQRTLVDALEWIVARENLSDWSSMSPDDLRRRPRETLSDGNSTVGDDIEGVSTLKLPRHDN